MKKLLNFKFKNVVVFKIYLLLIGSRMKITLCWYFFLTFNDKNYKTPCKLQINNYFKFCC